MQARGHGYEALPQLLRGLFPRLGGQLCTPQQNPNVEQDCLAFHKTAWWHWGAENRARPGMRQEEGTGTHRTLFMNVHNNFIHDAYREWNDHVYLLDNLSMWPGHMGVLVSQRHEQSTGI